MQLTASVFIALLAATSTLAAPTPYQAKLVTGDRSAIRNDRNALKNDQKNFMQDLRLHHRRSDDEAKRKQIEADKRKKVAKHHRRDSYDKAAEKAQRKADKKNAAKHHRRSLVGSAVKVAAHATKPTGNKPNVKNGKDRRDLLEIDELD